MIKEITRAKGFLGNGLESTLESGRVWVGVTYSLTARCRVGWYVENWCLNMFRWTDWLLLPLRPEEMNDF